MVCKKEEIKCSSIIEQYINDWLWWCYEIKN